MHLLRHTAPLIGVVLFQSGSFKKLDLYLKFQAFNYQGENLLAQDKCGEAIRSLKESQECKWQLFVYIFEKSQLIVYN